MKNFNILWVLLLTIFVNGQQTYNSNKDAKSKPTSQHKQLKASLDKWTLVYKKQIEPIIYLADSQITSLEEDSILPYIGKTKQEVDDLMKKCYDIRKCHDTHREEYNQLEYASHKHIFNRLSSKFRDDQNKIKQNLLEFISAYNNLDRMAEHSRMGIFGTDCRGTHYATYELYFEKGCTKRELNQEEKAALNIDETLSNFYLAYPEFTKEDLYAEFFEKQSTIDLINYLNEKLFNKYNNIEQILNQLNKQ